MSASSPKTNPENPDSRQARPVPDVELTRQRRDARYLNSLLEDFNLGRSGLEKRQEASATSQVSGSVDRPPEFRDIAAEFVLGRMQDMVVSQSPADQPSLFPIHRPVPDIGVVGSYQPPPLPPPESGAEAQAPGHEQGLNLEAEGVPSVQNAPAEVSGTPRHTSLNLIFFSALKNIVEVARRARVRSRSVFSRRWGKVSSLLQLPAVKQVLRNTARLPEATRSVLTRRINLLSPVWRNPLSLWQSVWVRRLTWRPVISKLSNGLVRGASRAQTSESLKVAHKIIHALPARRDFPRLFRRTPWVVVFSVMIAVLVSAQAYYLWWPALHTQSQAQQAITPQWSVSRAISNQTPGNEPLKPQVTLKPASAAGHDQITQGPLPSAAEVPPALGSSRQALANRAQPNSGLKTRHPATARRSRHRKFHHKTSHQNGRQ